MAIGAVLAGSWLLWLLWQRWPAQTGVPWTIADFPTFNLSAWQVLFVTSLVLGYHRAELERRLASVSRLLILAGAGAVFGAAIAVFFVGVAPSGHLLGTPLTVAQVFGKADLRIGRLFVFAAFAIWLYVLLTLAWVPLRRVLGWLLLPLGEHALTAYMLHLFVVAVLTAATAATRSTLENTIVQAAGIMLVWAMIVYKPTVVARCHQLAEPAVWVAQLLARLRVIALAHGETPQFEVAPLAEPSDGREARV